MRSLLSARATALLLAFAAFTVWVTWRAKTIESLALERNAPSPLVGKPAPGFKLESLEGRTVSLDEYRGKTVVVSFWASWCGPCRLEMPGLAKLYAKNHNSGSDFEILAVSIETTKDAAGAAARSMKIPFPVLLDADHRLADSYHVEAIPMLFVVDKSGKVLYSHLGFQAGSDMLLAQQLGIGNYSAFGGGR
jgi:peroxiredoxin